MLTDMQTAFVNYYVGLSHFNASDAARRAGYKVPHIQGQNLKAKPEVRAAIDAFLSSETLTAKEVLSRLTDHARGTLKHFVSIPKRPVKQYEFDDDGKEQASDEETSVAFGTPRVNLSSKEADDHFHLLKKLKIKERQGGKEEDAWTETEIEFEIHDPQAALVHLGRHYKLFTDMQEISGPNGVALEVTLTQQAQKVYGSDTDDTGQS